ncbi:hypothetical protein L484_016633 [Morus notabilis]|uniref:Uncharacterized protein n=1 Tax=Morus notabilis TaxID=981085 RepID=W9RUR5_9ROSA|nr:hypothetical protein L484_016633 [Morus notabilis]
MTQPMRGPRGKEEGFESQAVKLSKRDHQMAANRKKHQPCQKKPPAVRIEPPQRPSHPTLTVLENASQTFSF